MLEHWTMAGQSAPAFWDATPREFIAVMRGYRADLRLRGIIKPKSKAEQSNAASPSEGLRAWAGVIQNMGKRA